MPSIPYHFDDERGAVLSLQWVHPSEQRVMEVERDKRTSNEHSLVEYRSEIETHDHLPTTIYSLYEAELHPREYPDLESEDILSLSQEERVFVDTVLDAFAGVEEEWENTGKEVRWYKPPDVETIINVLNRVEFRQPVAYVGGELLSRFITEHPLPNGNHRVGLSLLETYLATYDSGFEMPNTGVTGGWFDWAEEFVYQSKRLMTLARKCGLLRNLSTYGCNAVVRDGDNVLLFEDYDLQVDNYFDTYANEKHLESSVGFVHGVLDRTNNYELIATEDRGLAEFIQKLTA